MTRSFSLSSSLNCAGNDDVVFQLVAEFSHAGKLAAGMKSDIDVTFSFAFLEVESTFPLTVIG